jgi:hypothetical protein
MHYHALAVVALLFLTSPVLSFDYPANCFFSVDQDSQGVCLFYGGREEGGEMREGDEGRRMREMGRGEEGAQMTF